MSNQNQYNRAISTALLAVMLLSVLQFCVMPLANAKLFQADETAPLMANMENHDCCLNDISKMEMETTCPDCDDIDSALKVSIPDQSDPLFTLLYFVTQVTLDHSQEIQHWRSDTEPNILAVRPNIYLTNATFLE